MDRKEKFVHFIVIEENPSRAEILLGNCAKSAGFRKIELKKEQIDHLLSQMKPSDYETTLLDSTAKNSLWRVYSVLPGLEGYASFLACHRLGGIGLRERFFRRELTQLSEISNKSVFYFSDEEFDDDDTQQRYQIYQDGRLKKDVAIFIGGGPKLIQIDGKQVSWPEEKREKIDGSIRLDQPPLPGEFYEKQGFDLKAIRYADEMSLRLQGGFSLGRPQVFLSKRFSDFESYNRFFQVREGIRRILFFTETAFWLVLVIGALVLMLRGCVQLFVK